MLHSYGVVAIWMTYLIYIILALRYFNVNILISVSDDNKTQLLYMKEECLFFCVSHAQLIARYNFPVINNRNVSIQVNMYP